MLKASLDSMTDSIVVLITQTQRLCFIICLVFIPFWKQMCCYMEIQLTTLIECLLLLINHTRTLWMTSVMCENWFRSSTSCQKCIRIQTKLTLAKEMMEKLFQTFLYHNGQIKIPSSLLLLWERHLNRSMYLQISISGLTTSLVANKETKKPLCLLTLTVELPTLRTYRETSIFLKLLTLFWKLHTKIKVTIMGKPQSSCSKQEKDIQWSKLVNKHSRRT